ncbi:MAG: dihydroorotate dehydrogenase [Candidatus Omnitrophica bacterium]|nr:dihydroorotate dehydrogenase [Candidatus Omnitrophota bacterium]
MNTAVKIGKIWLKNPVMVASGTFGVGEKYSDFIDINKIGAIVTKTITLIARVGNAPPRLVETPAGLLNSIGLENKGLKDFVNNKIPFLKKLKIPAIVSIGGKNRGEFVELSKRLSDCGIDGIEINISCPNVKAKTKKLISQDKKETFELVKSIRKSTKLTLITKLSPNVTDITEIAKAAQDAESDAISLVNTFLGMAVDVETQKPKLGAVTGGLSGPAIKPVALRMVWEVFNKVKIPIIGIGGIMDYKDALEFIVCGATAVQVGTANFINPNATIEIIGKMKGFLRNNKIKDIKALVGSLKHNG